MAVKIARDTVTEGGGGQTGPTDQPDIRLFLTKGGKNAEQTIHHASNEMNLTFSIPQETEDPIDKIRMIRNKMVDARRAADRVKNREAMAKTEIMRKKWNDEDLIHAKDVDRDCVQDPL